jgi:hypothetical protein
MSRIATLEQQAQRAIRKRLAQRRGPADAPALRRAILQDALQSWPSLSIGAGTIIALGVVVMVFSASLVVAVGVALLVVGAGGLMLGGWLWLAMRDDSHRERAIAAHRPNPAVFSLAELRDQKLRSRLLQAGRGWQQIQAASNSMPVGVVRDRADATAAEVTDWLHHAYLLAVQADRLLLNAALSQSSLPKNNQSLNKTRQVIAQRMQQTYEQLDHTVTGLNNVYAQLLLIAASGQPVRHTNRLESEISEEIARLQDLTAAMHEVYHSVSAD